MGNNIDWCFRTEEFPRTKRKGKFCLVFPARNRDEALKYIKRFTVNLNPNNERVYCNKTFKMLGINASNHHINKVYSYWSLSIYNPNEKQDRQRAREKRQSNLLKLVKKRGRVQAFSKLPKPVKDRIFKKPNSCWVWTGALNNESYGIYNRKAAHRLVYSLLVDEIPKGIILLHSCDNRMCVNPRHLEPGTPKQNHDDMVAKDRCKINKFSKYYYGETASDYDLTKKDLKVIRLKHHVNNKNIESLSNEYDLDKQIIENILNYIITK